MPPLRILAINWLDRRNPEAGGAEVHLHEIFGRLNARGHTVELLASGWPGCAREEEVDGIRVHRSGSRHTFPLTVRRAYGRVGGRGFDVVVEDVNKLPLFTPLWVREPIATLVPHLFGGIAFREASWPVAALVWAAERAMPPVYRRTPVQAISVGTADDLARRGFARDRIRVVPPGIDHGRFRPDSGVGKFEEPTLLYVGRLKRYKGLDVVLRSLRRLLEQGVRARLLVAGRGDDLERLRRVAAREGVGEETSFLGFVPEERKVELLRRAWVHVYPSPKEGWGIANVEAAACGTPAVASDSPGLRESVADGVSGFLAPHGDDAAWAERLGRLLRDARLREKLGAGAIRHATRFSWDRAAADTERWLMEACGKAVADSEEPRQASNREGGQGCR